MKFYGPRSLELRFNKKVEDEDLIFVPTPSQVAICKACANVQIHNETWWHGKGFPECAVASGERSATWTGEFRDEDPTDAFLRVGATCPNLQKRNVSSWITTVTEDALRGLLSPPKVKLREIDIGVTDSVSMRAIFTVLADKVCFRETFGYAGPTPCLDLLRLFIHSQKELNEISFLSDEDCIC